MLPCGQATLPGQAPIRRPAAYTSHLVTSLIERELAREGLPAAAFLGAGPTHVSLAKTADRSVLGCMNDMALHCQYAMSDYGGLHGSGIGELNQSLRRNINSARGYRPPIDLAMERARGG